MNRITLYHQDVPVTHYPLEKNSFSIGTAPENDMILTGYGVADCHCVVFRENDGRWRARPLDSDEPLTDMPLEFGKRIPLGPFKVALESFPISSSHGSDGVPERVTTGSPEEPDLGIVGNSPQLQLLKMDMDRIAPMSAPVLITGETGTGKELVARGLHRLSRKPEGPFVVINCGCLTETLLEDTFFGHERGSFTGASRVQRGVFEQAAGGTLFLDEIGELPFKQQATLLRILEDKVVKRIGSSAELPVDFRLLTATNRDLTEMISNNLFRLDSYHRISTLRIATAPLRERPEDTRSLCFHFLSEMEDDVGPRTLSPNAMKKIEQYPWPGNGRELRNSLYRAAVLSQNETLKPADFQFDEEKTTLKAKSFRLDDIPQTKLEFLLSQHEGNVTATARTLGIPRSSLRDRLYRRKKSKGDARSSNL